MRAQNALMLRARRPASRATRSLWCATCPFPHNIALTEEGWYQIIPTPIDGCTVRYQRPTAVVMFTLPLAVKEKGKLGARGELVAKALCGPFRYPLPFQPANHCLQSGIALWGGRVTALQHNHEDRSGSSAPVRSQMKLPDTTTGTGSARARRASGFSVCCPPNALCPHLRATEPPPFRYLQPTPSCDIFEEA
jgi:hypothetical protein